MGDAIPSEVLAAFGIAGDADVRSLDGGLINRTFLVDSQLVVQRVNPIFSVEVHDDIEAVTRELARKKQVTPHLARTREGKLWLRDGEGGVWRAMTFIAGRTIHRVDRIAIAQEAGRIVGAFHAALADFSYTFTSRRLGVHDTAKHFATLHAAVDQHRVHALHDDVARLADELSSAYSALPKLSEIALPERIVHGDLKISNILFDHSDNDNARAICLVDLDTLARMTLPYELGDAWRSWCNPAGEDTVDTGFDLALLDAAWRGYRDPARAFLTPAERELLVVGVLTISLELSARFAADALNASYFGWDSKRFASSSEHNWVRARGQAGVYRALATQRADAERIVLLS